MKKEKSLNFLSSRWLMTAFLALGILFCSNSIFAQNSPFANKIVNMTELRDSFAPSSAKYDIVDEAIDYLLVLEQQVIADPNSLENFSDIYGHEPLSADKIRRTHPTILRNYTPAQLAEIAGLLGEYTSSNSANPEGAQKAQWILDANAY